MFPNLEDKVRVRKGLKIAAMTLLHLGSAEEEKAGLSSQEMTLDFLKNYFTEYLPFHIR